MGSKLIRKFFQQNFKRPVRYIKLVALLFELFDLAHNLSTIIAVVSQFNSELFGLVFHIAFTGKIRYEHPTLISDLTGINMFISLWGFHDGTDMNASLVGEGTFANKRTAIYRNQIGRFIDIA